MRDEQGVELHPMPPGYLELLRDRDPFALAVKVYEELTTLYPPSIPDPARFSRPDLIKLWRKRGVPIRDESIGIGQPDTLKAEFMGWLERELERSDIIDDARRRLRSTMWAEVTLRASSRRPDAVAVLARHHAIHWKIARVEECSKAREKQIETAIRLLARTST
jgi:hypothetical protein